MVSSALSQLRSNNALTCYLLASVYVSQADQNSYMEKPKYRCPRCRTKTCSLSCYKRHQQRASCSGKRDPAAYVKKSQWATPTGIDHDYNYLKTVERSIDEAGQHAHQRGIGVDAPTSKGAARAWQSGSTLQKYLSRNRIIVDHAPTGMNRQRTNQTRMTKSGNVVWTVEWIDPTGRHDVQNDCLESESITQLHVALVTEKRNAKKCRSSLDQARTQQRGVKRKRVKPEMDSQHIINEQFQAQDIGSMQRAKSGDNPNALSGKAEPPIGDHLDSKHFADAEHTDQFQNARGAEQAIEQEAHIKPDPRDDETARESASHDSAGFRYHADIATQGATSGSSCSTVHFIPDSERTQLHPDQLATPEAIQHTFEPPDSKSDPEQYYYLLKPATTSAQRILIQLSAKASLTESLEDQVVQEYPTIYVLPYAPESLPEDFLLYEEYIRMVHRRTEHLLAHSNRSGNDSTPAMKTQEQTGPGHKSKGLDATSILDMLKRDVTL